MTHHRFLSDAQAHRPTNPCLEPEESRQNSDHAFKHRHMKGEPVYPYQSDFYCLFNVPSHGKECVRMKRGVLAPLVAPF